MTGHKPELHQRAEERRAQLQDALALCEKEGPSARRDALEMELKVFDMAVQGGWDKVSEAGAAELSRWLETTRTLVDTRPPASAPASGGLG